LNKVYRTLYHLCREKKYHLIFGTSSKSTSHLLTPHVMSDMVALEAMSFCKCYKLHPQTYFSLPHLHLSWRASSYFIALQVTCVLQHYTFHPLKNQNIRLDSSNLEFSCKFLFVLLSFFLLQNIIVGFENHCRWFWKLKGLSNIGWVPTKTSELGQVSTQFLWKELTSKEVITKEYQPK
jgi:hypothetical protein